MKDLQKMSDDADQAQSSIELDDMIRRKYTRRPELEVEATGECLNCYEPIGDGMRWCNAECRFDWKARRDRG